jgi:TonB family protein
MNYYFKIAVVLGLMLAGKGLASGQDAKADALPAVTTAVAPNYFPTALHSHASGEVVVAVKIAADGSVTSTESISGNRLLAAGSRNVARRWRFAAIEDKQQIRTARLTFVYHLVPRGTPSDQLLPMFKPPYRVEISHELPDETPLP